MGMQYTTGTISIYCDLEQSVGLNVGQGHSFWNSSKVQIVCKSVQEIRSYRANEILHCKKYIKGMSRSLIFELTEGYGGMHDWVKLCVYQCMKSEVIALTRFCIATWKSRSKVGQGHSSKAMVV